MIQPQELSDVIRMHRKAAKLSRDKLEKMPIQGAQPKLSAAHILIPMCSASETT
jgi:hypothetical protein